MADPQNSPVARTGYSTQASISLAVAELINNRRINFWCASVINPRDNNLSSNPLAIFAQLSRFLHGGLLKPDVDKAETLEANLMGWVYQMHPHMVNDDLRNQALAMIGESFREKNFEPRMFRLSDLMDVRERDEPDEFVVPNEPVEGQHVRTIETVHLNQDF